MLMHKSYFKLVFVLVFICLPVFFLSGQLFVVQRDVSRSVDFFEMSLEELMTVEVTLIDKPEASRPADFFEMHLEELMAVEVS
jgi:hypothetical protein